jgi:hypothetical protein
LGDLVARLPALAHPVSAATLGGLITVVTAVTAAQASGVIALRSIAASPQQIASGRLWLLVTSGLLVQKPFAVSLLSFAALGVLTLALCGYRVFAWSAVVGHVLSTLVVYACLAVVWAASPEAFGQTWSAPDFGVSAVSAAWLGAVASVAWRRAGGRVVARASIFVACLAVAAIGWLIRGHLNVLDSEHGFAFAVGAAVSWLLARETALTTWLVLRQSNNDALSPDYL